MDGWVDGSTGWSVKSTINTKLRREPQAYDNVSILYGGKSGLQSNGGYIP